MDVGIVGGTGPLGRGLAARWTASGLPVTIGSRDPRRAADAADEVRRRVADAGGIDVGVGDGLAAGRNHDAAAADVVVLAVPHAALDATLDDLHEPLAGRVVVSAVNPLGFDQDGPRPLEVAEGSVALACAARLPTSRVVAAFHSVAVRSLLRLDAPLDEDVPVFADDEEALALVAGLTDRIEGARGVPAGPLRLAGVMEAMTAVIISVNQRHKSHVGIRFTRLDR